MRWLVERSSGTGRAFGCVKVNGNIAWGVRFDRASLTTQLRRRRSSSDDIRTPLAATTTTCQIQARHDHTSSKTNLHRSRGDLSGGQINHSLLGKHYLCSVPLFSLGVQDRWAFWADTANSKTPQPCLILYFWNYLRHKYTECQAWRFQGTVKKQVMFYKNTLFFLGPK